MPSVLPRSAPLAAAALLLAACTDASGPVDFDSRFGVTECTTAATGSTVGNLAIRAGQSCALDAITVQGNVVVFEGGTLRLIGGQVDGNIQAKRPLLLEVVGTRVDGNIQVEYGTAVVITGATVEGNIQVKKMTGPGPVAISIMNNTVLGGDIQVEENRPATLEITGNAVGSGNLQVFKNTGSGTKRVAGNTVAQNLQCKENASPFVAESNVAGDREDQCS